MSRGPGSLQQRICDVLDATDDPELPLRELRRRLGEPDRSNLRRAIRGLLERGILEESTLGGRASHGAHRLESFKAEEPARLLPRRAGPLRPGAREGARDGKGWARSRASRAEDNPYEFRPTITTPRR